MEQHAAEHRACSVGDRSDETQRVWHAGTDRSAPLSRSPGYVHRTLQP